MSVTHSVAPSVPAAVAQPVGYERQCKRLSRWLYASLLAFVTLVCIAMLAAQTVLLGNDALLGQVAMVLYLALAWTTVASALAAFALAGFASVRRVPRSRSYWFSLAYYATGAAVAFGLLL